MPAGDPVRQRNREAFATATEAFGAYIGRHARLARSLAAGATGRRADELCRLADDCDHLAERPATGFRQALQMVWFVHVFLHAEGGAVAYSFGRFDQYLWPYLEADLQTGELTWDEAAELVACFLLKCCEGDESQNLVVGGLDGAGTNAENPLSLLALEVSRELAVWQPSVSVRIHDGSSDEFWDGAVRLCAAGFGMPSFFADGVVTEALVAAGVSPSRAWDWGIVGCYEAAPQGDTGEVTTGGRWQLPAVLAEWFATLDEPETFSALLDDLRQYLAADWRERWDEAAEHCRQMAERQPSPFEAVCTSGCIESGLTCQEGGARHSLYVVQILGLGTLVDSLWCIRQLVFEDRAISLRTLREQVAADFPDDALRLRCRNLAGKYGTDSEGSNALAEELSAHVADLVLSRPLPDGTQPYPAFFNWLADVHVQFAATPDGRRTGERVSYGAGPTELALGRTPTSTANSAAHLAHRRCAAGNPLLISLPAADVAGPAGRQRLRHLVEGYFRQGGFHVHFNVLDAEQLRRAKAEPERHADLTVRISGYSARFCALDERLQDALIARAELGL